MANMARLAICTFLAAFLMAEHASAQPAPQPQTPEVQKCRGMIGNHADIMDAPSWIVAARQIDATPSQPAHCKVEGYVNPNIGFEMLLPSQNWNGKFFKVGCGGYCGFISIMSCQEPLRRGYACLAQDMGHKSTGLDAVWAYNNLQAEVDWGYRSTHVAALAGKAFTEKYYGKAPARSYYMGGSTGGRQGLVQAQRFPYDFDGIVAGVGPINETGDGMTIMWNVLHMLDKQGKPLFTAAELEMVHAAVLEQCDMDDNVKDGLIADPRACKFDPRNLVCKAGKKSECLSGEQADNIAKVYQGPTNSKGEMLYTGGSVKGSELSWFQSYIPVNGGGRYYEMMEEMFRYMGFHPDPGPSWTLTDFNWDRDYKRMDTMEMLYSGSNPDLRRFKKEGNKMIVWHGWWDQAVFPEYMIDYYETAERTMGGRAATQDFFRLFMVPGQSHGGPYLGAQTVDYLSAIEAWVEKGQAPDKLIGYHLKNPRGADFSSPTKDAANVAFSRPLYPYPLQAHYSGQGDPNDAANFVPFDPK